MRTAGHGRDEEVLRFTCTCSCCLLVGQELSQDEGVRREIMKLHHLIEGEEVPQAKVKMIRELLQLAR